MLFWAKRLLISKAFSTSTFQKSPSHASPASTLWFIKVVCTLCINHCNSLTFFNTDYFRNNLNPYVAYGVIYHLNNRLNNPDLAFSFFRYSRLSLNVVHLESTFDLLLRSLVRMGLHDSVKLVYEYMRDDGFLVQSSVLDFLVSSFGSAGKFSFAEEILIAKGEECVEKGEVVCSFVYINFLKLLIDRNRVEEAVALFRGHVLRLRSFCPDTYCFNIVMKGLCREGKVEKAFEFFDVMRGFGCHPDLVSYNTIIHGLCRVGKVRRAEELLREVIKVQCGFLPDVRTYTSVIAGYCKSGEMENAVTLLDEMISNGIRPNLVTFNAIIDGFGKKGSVALASKMYEKMVGGGCHPDVVTFTSLIEGHCRVGELAQGMQLWSEMNERKLSPNAFTFSILINALCRENRLIEARDLLRELNWREDIVPKPFIYNPVIDGFCKAGNVDEANTIVAEMEAKGCVHDKQTFTILILGHCMKGRMLEAIGLYNKMLLVGCVPDHVAINSLISRLRKAGMAREANEIELKASNGVQSGLSSSERTTTSRSNTNVRIAV